MTRRMALLRWTRWVFNAQTKRPPNFRDPAVADMNLCGLLVPQCPRQHGNVLASLCPRSTTAPLTPISPHWWIITGAVGAGVTMKTRSTA